MPARPRVQGPGQCGHGYRAGRGGASPQMQLQNLTPNLEGDSPPAFSHLLVKSEVIGALRVEERNFDGSDQIGRNLSQLSPISICFFQTPTSLPSSCTGSKLWPLKV